MEKYLTLIAIIGIYIQSTKIANGQLPEARQRQKPNREQLKKYLMGRGSKLNETDLQRMHESLIRMRRKVIQEYAGRTLKRIPQNPEYNVVEGQPQTIPQINVDMTDYLYQSDIVLPPDHLDSLLPPTLNSNNRRKRKATTVAAWKWPTSSTGFIPYFLDASLTQRKKDVITQALQFWQENTCVTFKLNGAGKNSLLFFSGGGCYSYVGMIGGQQQISIGDGCEYFGIVTHEVAHALGFYHEQARYDRAPFISLNLANILAGSEDNFNIQTAMNFYGIPYEYGSIMHYSSTDFSKNVSIPTVVATDPYYQQTMGQGKGPSFLDVLEMNRYYGCDNACSSAKLIVCQNGGYQDPKNCSLCKCPSGFGGQFCDQVQPADNGNCGGVLVATSKWTTFAASVGTANLTDTPTTCYWHITAPTNTKAQVRLTRISGSCSAGCFWNAIEFKPSGDYQKTGYRYCCLADIANVPFTSVTNIIPVVAYGAFSMSFTIQYQYVSDNTTETPSSTSSSTASSRTSTTPSSSSTITTTPSSTSTKPTTITTTITPSTTLTSTTTTKPTTTTTTTSTTTSSTAPPSTTTLTSKITTNPITASTTLPTALAAATSTASTLATTKPVSTTTTTPSGTTKTTITTYTSTTASTTAGTPTSTSTTMPTTTPAAATFTTLGAAIITTSTIATTTYASTKTTAPAAVSTTVTTTIVAKEGPTTTTTVITTTTTANPISSVSNVTSNINCEQILNSTECPKNGIWSDWTPITNCTDECGACGTQSKYRTCLSAKQGCPCMGSELALNVTCNPQVCTYPRVVCCEPYEIGSFNGKFICM